MNELTIYTGTLPDPTGGCLTADFVTLRDYKCLQAVVCRVAALADVTSLLELSGEWVALIQQARTALGMKPVGGEVKP